MQSQNRILQVSETDELILNLEINTMGFIDPEFKNKDKKTKDLIKGRIEVAKNILKNLEKRNIDINSLKNSVGYPLLHHFCLHGNFLMVKLLLEMNTIDINLEMEQVVNGVKRKLTPLTIACSDSIQAHRFIVDSLLAAKVQLNDISIGLNAALYGHEAVVKKLITDNIIPVDHLYKKNATMLYLACQGGHINIVNFLLDHHANINHQIDTAQTPIHVASLFGHSAIVETLIKKNATIDLADEDGKTPFYLACENGHRVVAEILLKEHARLTDYDPVAKKALLDYEIEGRTVLWSVVGNNTININLRKNIIRWLLKEGASIENGPGGQTSLWTACYDGNQDIAEILIHHNKNCVNISTMDGTSPLFIACQQGHIEIAKLLLANNANINQLKELTISPLYVACQLGHTDIVKLLLERGAEFNPYVKDTPLYIACYRGNLNIVELIINKFIAMNEPLSNEILPLIVACQNGHFDIVKLLVNKGVNLNGLFEDFTPLSMAVWKDNVPMAEWLIQQGADLKKANNIGVTALTAAARYGQTNTVKLLIEAYKNQNLSLTDDLNPLSFAIENKHNETVDLLLNNNLNQYFYVACQTGWFKLIKFLLEKGANLAYQSNTASPAGAQTALAAACRNGHHDIVELLIDQEAANHEPDFIKLLHTTIQNEHQTITELLLNRIEIPTSELNRPYQGSTLLYLASQQGFAAIIELLLKEEIEINKYNTVEKMTALHIASQFGYLDVVQLLIKHGAEIDIKNRAGKMPIHLAYEYVHPKITELLLAATVFPDHEKAAYMTYLTKALQIALEYGQKDLIKMLIERGADVNAILEKGQSVFHLACFKGDRDIVNLMIELGGADLNKADRSKEGKTPLYIACEKNNIEVVDLLIQKGVKVNKMTTHSGKTPISMACKNNCFAIVEYLIRAKADVLIKNDDNTTPISLTTDDKIVELLIKQGAKRPEVKATASGESYAQANSLFTPTSPTIRRAIKTKKSATQKKEENEVKEEKESPKLPLATNTITVLKSRNFCSFGEGVLSSMIDDVKIVNGPGLPKDRPTNFFYCPPHLLTELAESDTPDIFKELLEYPVLDELNGLKELRDIEEGLFELKRHHTKARLFCLKITSDANNIGTQGTLYAAFKFDKNGAHDLGDIKSLTQQLKFKKASLVEAIFKDLVIKDDIKSLIVKNSINKV